MLGGSMDLYGQMPSAYDWASFEFLAHENYSSWQIFMHKLLYSYGQEHLDIVLGKHTRLDAEDKHKFDAVDEIALSTIRLAIDKEIHPWVLDVFSSSKELWDSLQFKFEIDAVMATMIADTDVHQEDIPYTFPHDDYKIVENLGEAQAARIKHEHTMSNEDNVHDISPSSMIQTSFDIADYAVTEMLLESSPLYIAPVPALQGALIQDICNEIEDKHMVVSCEWSADFSEQDILSDLIMDTAPDVPPDVPLGYIRAACFENDHKFTLQSASDALTSLCLLEDHVQQGQNNSYEHRDEIFEHQAYTADFKDELVLQLPWMDIYEQNAGFSSIITKVSKHEVDFPLYIHLHIPFACTHDGKVEDHSNLDGCLGYISYPGIGGFTNSLKVNYRCLHVRNQVLIILDIYDHTSHSTDSLPEQFGVDQSESSNNNSLDLYDTDMIGRLSDVICEFYHSTESDFLRKVYALQKIYIVDMGYQSHAGSYISSMNVYITKTREWYRGRKIWFKTKFQWHPWLLMWLSLLYMLNFRTCNISGGMLVLGFIVLFFFSAMHVIRGDVRV